MGTIIAIDDMQDLQGAVKTKNKATQGALGGHQDASTTSAMQLRQVAMVTMKLLKAMALDMKLLKAMVPTIMTNKATAMRRPKATTVTTMSLAMSMKNTCKTSTTGALQMSHQPIEKLAKEVPAPTPTMGMTVVDTNLSMPQGTTLPMVIQINQRMRRRGASSKLRRRWPLSLVEIVSFHSWTQQFSRTSFI